MRLDDMGAHELKGLSGARHVFRVVGQSRTDDRKTRSAAIA